MPNLPPWAGFDLFQPTVIAGTGAKSLVQFTSSFSSDLGDSVQQAEGTSSPTTLTARGIALLITADDTKCGLLQWKIWLATFVFFLGWLWLHRLPSSWDTYGTADNRKLP